MTKRTFNAETRMVRNRRTNERLDDQATCESKGTETTKVCLFKLWEAERREAAN